MTDEVFYCDNPLCGKPLDPQDHVRARGQYETKGDDDDLSEYFARPVLRFCTKGCWAEAVNNDEFFRAHYRSYGADL
jgi:hypothetical protein